MDFEPFLFAGSDTDVASTIGVSDSADVELFGIPKLPKLGTYNVHDLLILEVGDAGGLYDGDCV